MGAHEWTDESRRRLSATQRQAAARRRARGRPMTPDEVVEATRASNERYRRRIGHRPFDEWAAEVRRPHGSGPSAYRRCVRDNGRACDACRAAEAARMAAYRARRRAGPEDAHGR